MQTDLRRLKLELFHIRKSFFTYRRGFDYLYSKFILSKKIQYIHSHIDKPINNLNLSVHILTCHRDLTMTLWSLLSYYEAATIFGQLYIHDDGSLTTEDRNVIQRLLPRAKLLNTDTFVEQNETELSTFPVLRRFRTDFKKFFSFKKIIDPYFSSHAKMKMIIDSDILWFLRPDEIEANIEKGCPVSFMQANNSSIYATFKDGTRLDESLARFNAGIILYSIDHFNMLKFLEFLERLDIRQERNLHFTDQTGHAYCLDNLQALPVDRYVIKAPLGPHVVAKHYTGPRRAQFYFEGMKKFVNTIS